MTKRAFIIAANQASVVANDVTDFRYRAASHVLAMGEQGGVRCNDLLETQIMVQTGTVEFMIDGASAIAFAGDFVRVRAGAFYAWRNAGDISARILVRTVSPAPVSRALLIGYDFAA